MLAGLFLIVSKDFKRSPKIALGVALIPLPPQTYAEGSRKNTGNLYLQMHAAQAVLFQNTVADPPTDCLLLIFFVITMTTFVLCSQDMLVFFVFCVC